MALLSNSNISNLSILLNNTTNGAVNFPDTLWLMTSTALVFIMLPGLGFYYSGYIKRVSTLTIFMSILLPLAIVSIQWFLVGYSLVFSNTGSKIIGNFDNAFLRNVGNQPNLILTSVPSNVFMIYQCLFAAITPCIFFGAVAERGTITSFILISGIWSTFVYDFIAYWTWNKNGWLHQLGALDFAGGGPVHISSGFSAMAFALVVGPRKNVDFKNMKPVSLSEIFIGTCLLWVGWLGFNGGSEGAINARAINAVVVSNLSACTSGIIWVIIEMVFDKTKKISLNAFCTGAIAGLVSITPGCGYVTPVFSIVFGAITPVFCFLGTFIKRATKYKFDDTVDVFAVHGIGGMIGALLTGIFAQNSVVTLSSTSDYIPGGIVDGNNMQILYQLLAIVVVAAWSFIITFALVKIIDFVPFLKLRLDEEEQKIGSDFVELGELRYGVQEESKVFTIAKKSPTDEIKANKIKSPIKFLMKLVQKDNSKSELKETTHF